MKSKKIFLILIFTPIIFLLSVSVAMAGCCGSLNVSISGIDNCPVTAHMCADGCADGSPWKITKENGAVVTLYSGTVTNPGTGFYERDFSWSVTTGTYHYRLYINGIPESDQVVICPGLNNPPTCGYLDVANPVQKDPPSTVIFIANGSDSEGDISQYEFDFGDGSPLIYSSTAGATHTYNIPGTYCAKLRVKDNNNTWSANTGSCPGGVCTIQVIVTEPAQVITSPEVNTLQATNISTTSATLNGELLSLGYEPVTCPNCKAIVWFEWGTSGTAGVSGSYGSSTIPITATSTRPFSAVVPIAPGQTYYFEAFAKNGGSW